MGEQSVNNIIASLSDPINAPYAEALTVFAILNFIFFCYAMTLKRNADFKQKLRNERNKSVEDCYKKFDNCGTKVTKHYSL